MSGLNLFTIGYQGAALERFVAALVRAGVAVVVDVRAVPFSRKPGFSSRALASALAAAGIGYRHLGALGNPAPGRAAAKAGADAEYRRIFAAHLGGAAAQAALADAAATGRTAPCCLMCFERDARDCHRLLVAEALARDHGFAIRHLDGAA